MIIENVLRVLCFGDSLTAGYAVNHPYAFALRASLEKAFPQYDRIVTDVQGLPGDMVISPPGNYLPRMEKLYQAVDFVYDWAVILGGTNDLNNGRYGRDIYKGLRRVWEIPLHNGTNVVSLTVPECGTCPPTLDQRRDELNARIIESEAENFHVLDFHEAMPYWRMSQEERKRFWDDGVHFTIAGYDRMGSLIASEIVRLTAKLEAVEEESARQQIEEPHQVLQMKV